MAGKLQKAASVTRLAIGLSTLLACALAFASSVSAAASHPPFGSFCEPLGTGTAPCNPSFDQPQALAVDQSSGDLLVVDEVAGTVSRYHANGTPDDFAALGTNVIDGKGTPPCTPPSEECDGTPQGSLSFSSPQGTQVAVDESGGATDGDIYVTQFGAGVVDIFSPEGSFLGQLSGSSEGVFGPSCGVTVDPSGDVYVGEFGEPEGEVHKYEPSGAFPVNGDNTFNFPAPKPCAVAAGAGPTAGSVFAASIEGPVWKFNGSTGENEGEGEGPIIESPSTTLALNPETGHLYTAAGSPFSFVGRAVNEYDASGAEAKLLSSFEPPGPIFGLAVSEESGEVYVAGSGEHQVEVWGPAVAFPAPVTEAPCATGAEGATLCGSVNPEGTALSECVFEWGTTTAYGEEAPCEEPDAAEVGSGASPVPVHAQITGLQPGTRYHYRLTAANHNNAAGERALGEDESFLTRGASIEEELASLITPTSARLSAQVNPNGEEATYVFEYVTQQQYEESVLNAESGFAEATVLPEPPAEAGAGSEFEEAGQKLSGLAPKTTYHFRIAVSTPAITHLGPDLTFTTFAPNAGILPDERAYEMVSPPKKTGEVFPPEPSGDWTGSCHGCLPGINDELTAMQAAEDGEEVAYEGTPFIAGLAAGANEYLASRGGGGWATQSLTTPRFSGLEEQGFKAFSADLSRAVIYQIEPALSEEAPVDGEGTSYSNLYLREVDGTLVPLVMEAPPQREAGRESSDRFKIGFAGANVGAGLVGPLHHVIFEANDALTEVPGVAPAAPAITAEERNLYEWEDGALRLVNVAPGNPEEAIAGTTFGSGRELSEEKDGSGADFDGAISADGSRIFFSKRSTGQVYVRVNGEETLEVDDPGKFLVASANGSKVLLSDGCLYSLEAEECEDLSEGWGGFEGILGTSADLSRIYFVDTKVLDGGAEEGKPNLYAWDEGETSFIATLLPSDNQFNGVQPLVGDWMPSSGSRTAQVSPDGRFLAFMSRAQLTAPPYDNNVRGGEHCRAGQPAPCAEVFEYRAEGEGLICASCNPSGERPLGTSNLSLVFRGKNRIALAGFPQPTNLTSEEGRLFFESQDSLTPGDVNGNIKDVYEWEPEGIGSCERAKGCISLISSGKSPNDSIFLDATPSGDDAFFITRERLLPPDKDEKLDLYDARVGGGIPEPTEPPCGGEPCQEPGTPPPSPQGPASAGFSGPGNVPPKKKHHKHHKKGSKKHHKRKGGPK
jgi:hypothetical protein